MSNKNQLGQVTKEEKKENNENWEACRGEKSILKRLKIVFGDRLLYNMGNIQWFLILSCMKWYGFHGLISPPNITFNVVLFSTTYCDYPVFPEGLQKMRGKTGLQQSWNLSRKCFQSLDYLKDGAPNLYTQIGKQ